MSRDADKIRAAIRDAALGILFRPYRWGGNGPSDFGTHPVEVEKVIEGKKKLVREWHFWDPDQIPPHVYGGPDCSGLVTYSYREGGLNINDYNAQGWFDTLEEITAPQIGDLAFYGKNDDRVTHVTICLLDMGKAIIGANGGGAPKVGETFRQYEARMRGRHAMVRIEDQRTGGYAYRKDFLGFRRAPI